MPEQEQMTAQTAPESGKIGQRWLELQAGDQVRGKVFIPGASILLVVVAAALGGSTLWLYTQTPAWQMLGTTGTSGLVVVLALAAYGLDRRGRVDIARYLLLAAAAVVMAGGELFLSGNAVYFGLAGVMLLLTVGNLVLSGYRLGRVVAVGLFAAAIWLINEREPWTRFDVERTLLLQWLSLAVAVICATAFAAHIVRAYRRIDTIRGQLLVTFVALVLLTASAVSIASTVMARRISQEQVRNQLQSVATLKEGEIAAWEDSIQAILRTLANEEQVIADARMLVSRILPEEDRQTTHDRLQANFRQLAGQTDLLEEVFLMDERGLVVASTYATQEGKTRVYESDYFVMGLGRAYVSPPFYSVSLGRMSVVAVFPLTNELGQSIGVVAGRASLGRLTDIMLERTGLGSTGETYLIDSGGALLTSVRRPSEFRQGLPVRTEGALTVLRAQNGEGELSGFGEYENYQGESVIGVYRWIPSLQVGLLAEQSNAEALRPLRDTLVVNLGVAVIAVLVAGLMALLVTRSIATPLSALADTAEQIAAGDLGRVAETSRRDEVGTLARAFNSMTTQLRGLIGSLEQRVTERTADLAQRSVQLEAAAQVAREAAAIRDVDQLLDVTVQLISNRFGFYHAGIFLLDEAGEYALLRAASSEGGQRMLARGHRLRVGAVGIVGHVANTSQPRIALDVGADAAFFDNPDLPLTRSEMALPLVVQSRIIGVLDVQSMEEAAFSEKDLEILQTLADQVALAIQNAHLMEQTERQIKELDYLYGEQSRRAWRESAAVQQQVGFEYDRASIRPIEQTDAALVAQVVDIRTPRVLPPVDGEPATLLIPLQLRGQVIGLLGFERETGTWSEQEVSFAAALADQAALSLESARLFEDTRRMAERERLVRQITDQVRAAPDLEQLAHTAAQELAQALGVSHVFVRLRSAPVAQGEEG